MKSHLRFYSRPWKKPTQDVNWRIRRNGNLAELIMSRVGSDGIERAMYVKLSDSECLQLVDDVLDYLKKVNLQK